MKTQEQHISSLTSPVHNDGHCVLKMKSLQFRSIAPKALTVGSSPAVVPCKTPTTLPEASPTVSPQSILVPAQNYALMQVAGQEGTFSLIALPQRPQQTPTPKNLKLPIPRYQPMRCKRTLEKASCRTPVKVIKLSSASPPSVNINSVFSSLPKTPEPPSEIVCSATLSSEFLSSERFDHQSIDSLSYLSKTSGSNVSTPISNIPQINVKAEGAVSAGSPITVLSPTILGKAVQIIPSHPKGKLPILPYSKVKNTLIPSTNPIRTQSPSKVLLGQSKNSSYDDKTRTPNAKYSKQNTDTTQSKKLPGKKRGRRRKTTEDIRLFEARRKRSLSFFSRRIPEKKPSHPSSSQNELVNISNKFRTICPKPVFVLKTNVSQLLPTASLSTSETQTQQSFGGHQISGKPIKLIQPGLLSMQASREKSSAQPENASKMMYLSGQGLHRCLTCSRCFQFEHHLQSHMNSHGNLRPYCCPVCRKAYVHSSSLSTHMRLHHTEAKPGKSLHCKFCEKAFGYVGVYFSHLREVHKVILTVEPSVSHHEDSPASEGCPDPLDEVSEQPVELQIKCGRCQAVTATFADMKLHLLYVHNEDVQVRLNEEVLHDERHAERELVKHAAHYWWELNERRNLVRCGCCDKEFFSFSKLKRHLHSHHQGAIKSEVEEQDRGEVQVKIEHHSEQSAAGVTLRTDFHFNCILCSENFHRKQDVLEHWRSCHNCENAAMLWEILDLKTNVSLPHTASKINPEECNDQH